MEKDFDKLISVIIPVYNGAKFIIDALESVKDQTYKHWECIIIDDGSTDETALLVKKWIVVDDRFKYFYQVNGGLSVARNTGIKHASGELIQFLDADDVLLPLKFEKQIAHFEHSNKLVISYTNYISGTSDNIYKKSPYSSSVHFHTNDYLKELILRWESTLSIPPHCFLFSAAFFKKENILFDPELPNHEDFDCWVNVLKLRPDFHFLDEGLCIYRITENSMSKRMRLMGEGFLQVLDKHYVQSSQPSQFRKLLTRKKREVLRRYNRFDRMTFKEKALSIRHISVYYFKRIFQKTGLVAA